MGARRRRQLRGALDSFGFGRREADHQTDADCDVNLATDCCNGCGVLHGDPCLECGGRGYHRPECTRAEGAAERAAQ